MRNTNKEIRRGTKFSPAPVYVQFLSHDETAPSETRPPQYLGFTIVTGWTPMDEWPARRLDRYLATHNTQNNIHAPSWIRTRNPSKRATRRLTPYTVRPLGSAYFHIGPNIFLSALFADIFSLFFSKIVTNDRQSCGHLYVNIYVSESENRKTKDFCTER